MFTKTMSFIKNIKFRWSDLFFAIGAIFAILISVDSVKQMGTLNPVYTFTPFWLLIIYYFLSLGGLLTGLFFERKNLLNKTCIVASSIVFLLTLINFIVIFSQPNVIENTYTLSNNQSVLLGTHFSNQTKFVYFFNFSTLLLVFYIAIFVFPKRVANKKFLIFVFCLILVFTIFTILFSLIAEYKNYINLLKGLFAHTEGKEAIEKYAIKSIFHHRNIYGTLLEISVYISIINYSLTKNRINIYLFSIFYFFLLLTLCKTGIILCTLVILLFVLSNIIIVQRQNKKKLISSILIYCSIILSILMLVLIVYFSVPAIQNKINTLLDGGGTIVGRVKIWKKSISIIGNYFLVGRGYGVYNSMLYHVNTYVLSDKTFSSHSFIFSTLGRGGILCLIAFLTVLIYTYFIIIKSVKYSLTSSIFLLIILTSMIFHNLLEDNYYTIIVLSAVVMILFQDQKRANEINYESAQAL